MESQTTTMSLDVALVAAAPGTWLIIPFLRPPSLPLSLPTPTRPPPLRTCATPRLRSWGANFRLTFRYGSLFIVFVWVQSYLMIMSSVTSVTQACLGPRGKNEDIAQS